MLTCKMSICSEEACRTKKEIWIFSSSIRAEHHLFVSAALRRGNIQSHNFVPKGMGQKEG